MQISMFEASVPVFIRSLNNLAVILEKGAAYAEARKIDPAVLVGSRLFPDMFPLSRQVQIATDIAKGGASRLAGLRYLLQHVMPNVHFHVTTTYNILRHNGVELGKQDFLGPATP